MPSGALGAPGVPVEPAPPSVDPVAGAALAFVADGPPVADVAAAPPGAAPTVPGPVPTLGALPSAATRALPPAEPAAPPDGAPVEYLASVTGDAPSSESAPAPTEPSEPRPASGALASASTDPSVTAALAAVETAEALAAAPLALASRAVLVGETHDAAFVSGPADAAVVVTREPERVDVAAVAGREEAAIERVEAEVEEIDDTTTPPPDVYETLFASLGLPAPSSIRYQNILLLLSPMPMVAESVVESVIVGAIELTDDQSTLVERVESATSPVYWIAEKLESSAFM